MRFKDDLQKELYYRSQIDYCYYMIHDIYQYKGQMQSPIDAIIDECTVFNKEKIKENIDNLIYLIKVIIRCKPKCLAKYSVERDKQFLKELYKIKKLPYAK